MRTYLCTILMMPLVINLLQAEPFDHAALERKGYLSVTMEVDGQPGAIPSDGQDDTDAIQRVINKSIKDGMATFFPPGEYQISDTLEGVMPVKPHPSKPNQYLQVDRRKPTVLIGSTVGAERPVIKLVPTDGTFNNVSAPKPMLWIWAANRDGDGTNNGTIGSALPEDEQANISFSQVIRGVDFDLEGHSGAIGVRHAGSQGSTYTDSTIDATGAYAGIFNSPGQGGGVYNVRIIGGRYGVRIDSIARYPVMAGMVFEEQEEAAIYLDRIQPSFTMAGFSIRSSVAGSSALLIQANGRGGSHRGSVSLIDGRVELPAGSRAIENDSGRNVYLKNIHFGGGLTEITSPTSASF